MRISFCERKYFVVSKTLLLVDNSSQLSSIWILQSFHYSKRILSTIFLFILLFEVLKV